MLHGKKITLIGAGNMGEAIFSGALAGGAVQPQQLCVVDIAPQRLQTLAAQYGVRTCQNTADNTAAAAAAAESDIVVLAIKPQLAAPVLAALAPALTHQLVISIIGGTALATLQAALPQSAVIRVMPNTPMLVQKGLAALCPGAKASADDIALCKALFGAVGDSLLLDERLMNAFTAVSGCGPAYAYRFIQALADGGVQQGLPREVALRSAAQMLAGAAEMVLQTGMHPQQLCDNVCSPGGGTIVGVHALDEGGFSAAVQNAVIESCRRMDELG